MKRTVNNVIMMANSSKNFTHFRTFAVLISSMNMCMCSGVESVELCQCSDSDQSTLGSDRRIFRISNNHSEQSHSLSITTGI